MKNEKMAFAKSGAVDPCGNQLSGEQNGMTLREYYAGQALAGVMSNIHNIDKTDYVGLIGSRAVAKICTDLADALISELEGGK